MRDESTTLRHVRKPRRVAGMAFAIFLAVAAAACGPQALSATKPPAPAPPPPAVPPSGMNLVLSEDFNGAAIDTSRWDTCYPWADNAAGCTNFGNYELQWYVPSQVQVANGILRLVASKTPTDGTTRTGQPQSYPWRSGMVTTNPSLNFTYGYVEIRARVPRGDGFWPALWMLPTSMEHPPEIDFLEAWGDNTFETMLNFHPVPSGQHQQMHTSAVDLSLAFHTYSVHWAPGSIKWYIDGALVHSYTGTDVPNEPMYVLAVLAVSGDYPPTLSTPSPASLDLDWVRVYQ